MDENLKKVVANRVQNLLKKQASSLNLGLFADDETVLDALLIAVVKKGIASGDAKVLEFVTKLSENQDDTSDRSKDVFIKIIYPEKIIAPIPNE
jgi:hypothetical protein